MRRGGRKKTEGGEEAANRGGPVRLNEAQFRKLFKIVTGGDVKIKIDEGGARFEVSAEAILMAVPALLEKL